VSRLYGESTVVKLEPESTRGAYGLRSNSAPPRFISAESLSVSDLLGDLDAAGPGRPGAADVQLPVTARGDVRILRI
jgi:hypothetical protein